MKEEQIILVDENDNETGIVPRSRMIKENLRHRTSFIFVFNSERKLYVHKRSKNKDTFPGYWVIGAGGAVSAGDTYDYTARKELEEELGIKKEKLYFMFDFSYESEIDRYFAKVYKCIYNGKIRIQKDEIEKGAFKTIDEIKEMSEKGLLCPDTALYFKKYLEIKK